MSLTQNRWFRRFGFGAIAALALGVTAMSTAPAQAHDYGYRGPIVAHHASYFPRFFFGFGGGHHGYCQDHGDRRWR